MKRLAALLLLAWIGGAFAEAADTGWMRSYRDRGSYVLGGGAATVSISRDSRNRLVYTVSVPHRNGSQTGTFGTGNFVQDEKAAFLFPENEGTYWAFDGKTMVVRMTFWEHDPDSGITSESFTAHSRDCLGASMAAMPEPFLARLPADVQESIRQARRG